MMGKRKPKEIKLTPEYIRTHRKFPVRNTVILVVLVLIQIALVLTAVLYQPKPQDRIDSYEVTVEPLDNGSLDIEYSFVWTPLDESEPLTWIEIGMANPHYTVYTDSLSQTIREASSYSDEEGYVSLRLDLDRSYSAGETLVFSFKINQRNMLCTESGACFYEFVPGWFNATPVNSYTFRWKISNGLTASNTAMQEGDCLIWRGSFDCGEYALMHVRYTASSMAGVQAVVYTPFDGSGAYNELREDKIGAICFVVFVCILLLVAEVIIIDSYVSYHRGSGFISGYGHRMHVCGRVNPRYERARGQHGGSSSRGGGCACACACACAGGGRAGCSQKNTYHTEGEEE